MRHINPFPNFSRAECDELRKKIVHGVVMETFVASPVAHRNQAIAEGKTWPTYPCWIHAAQWEDGKGFKKFKFKGHTLYIHRASCELFNGPVLSTHLVDHLCRVRGCCQPAHLESVSPTENILRGANKNALLRKGEKSPCATDINPRIFAEPEHNEFHEEQLRRIREDRHGPARYWSAGRGVPPQAPLGFFWENIGGFGTISHILQPIRPPASARRTPVPVFEFEPEPLPKGMTEIEYIGRAPSAVLKGLDFVAVAPAHNPSPIEDMCAQHHTAYDDARPIPHHSAIEEWDAQGPVVRAMAPVGPEEPYHGDVYSWQQPKKPSWWQRARRAVKDWLDAPVGRWGGGPR